MENKGSKVGDIVMAKYGNLAIPFTNENGSTSHCNIGIWGIVTNITLNEKSKQDDILVKLMFDAKSFNTYKPEDLNVICSTNLVQAPVKQTLEQIRKDFWNEDICMSEFLASTPADGLSLEDAFELYIGARKWADGDRFFVDKDEDTLEEIGEGWDGSYAGMLFMARFENLIKLKEHIETNGAKVLSINQASELDDIDKDGLSYKDHALIVKLDPVIVGIHSTLKLFYYIDRRGNIVITESTLTID